MSRPGCPQEANVLKAARAGIGEESIATHIEACLTCRELARTAPWMHSLAQSSASARPLPDPARIWWRARLSEKQAKAERAQELFEWAEIISASVLCAAFAAWFIWDWSAIQFQFASALTRALPHSWLTVFPLLAATPAILSLFAVIASLAAAVLAYPILARD
jgi:hypothetical protein